MAHILKDYIALLDRSGLLAAPIPPAPFSFVRDPT